MTDQDPPLESFRSFVTLHLHLASRAMERFAEVHYRREFGMKVAECRVIGITALHGTASFRQICDDGAFEKSYASRLINTLHVRGLVDKTWSEVDQRTVYLSLTSAGRALYRRLHAEAARINECWLAAIPASERDAMLRNLELLTASARTLERRMDGLTKSTNRLPAPDGVDKPGGAKPMGGSGAHRPQDGDGA